MTRSELIEILADKHPDLMFKEVENSVKHMLEQMAQTLQDGKRVEIRGFGSFCLHYRAPRNGRNPKTGSTVRLEAKLVPHFKPGKELRERVNIFGQKPQQHRVAKVSHVSSEKENELI
jgi:integration host factor subunit beta